MLLSTMRHYGLGIVTFTVLWSALSPLARAQASGRANHSVQQLYEFTTRFFDAFLFPADIEQVTSLSPLHSKLSAAFFCGSMPRQYA